MKKEVFKYLQTYSTDTLSVNRLIISAFIEINGLQITNCSLILNHIITKEDEHELKHKTEFVELFRKHSLQFSFEDLIELFEFVISPADKVINGAVYTPKYIRDFIVEKSLSELNVPIDKALFADLSCGCGAFLFSLAQKLYQKTEASYATIFPRLFGLDITPYSIERTKILLALLALREGEDIEEIEFNLFCGNALDFNFNDASPVVNDNDGFDLIVGNPPYVCSRNMDEESLGFLDNWSVTKSGHPDLYIPFFQIGFESLSLNGILGFITVNTFLKSINGRVLRQYFANHQIKIRIINFGGEQIFKDRNTYTCLCFIQNQRGVVFYKQSLSSDLNIIKNDDFFEYPYENLNHHDGWNLADSSEVDAYIRIVEATGQPFKEKYITRNGIATLKNYIYKFKPINQDEDFYYLKTNDRRQYQIERGICRDIINANKIKTEKDLISNKEKIIYPYIQRDGETIILNEAGFQEKFPYAYRYLADHKKELKERDKGRRTYEEWYAYGRRQSLDIQSYKLFFPHICKRPTFVISEDKGLLFYNGIAVISDDMEELQTIKNILESDIFFKYIRHTTKDYSSGYISMSKNYIKNFGILNLSDIEKKQLLNCSNPNNFLINLYKVNGYFPLAGLNETQNRFVANLIIN